MNLIHSVIKSSLQRTAHSKLVDCGPVTSRVRYIVPPHNGVIVALSKSNVTINYVRCIIHIIYKKFPKDVLWLKVKKKKKRTSLEIS